MKHNDALTTLQARTICDYIAMTTTPLTTGKIVEKIAISIVDKCIETFPNVYSVNDRNNYLAFALMQTGKKAVKEKALTCIEYIKLIARQKQLNTEILNDFGAFGDLYEILIRLAIMKKINLINVNMLSVKDIKHSDIISKKYGILEIGHNGKTFQEGTLIDYMQGKYNAIIYGVFNNDDKQAIFDYCIKGDISSAIDYVKNYSVYWSDKYAFRADMDNLTRGKGITVKSGKVMLQYNEGKYNAFINAIENGKFKALSEIM